MIFIRCYYLVSMTLVKQIIFWIYNFQNNVLPSGEKSFESQSIVIQDLNRHHSGSYICTASNGVGQAASAEINLKVLCKLKGNYFGGVETGFI